MADTKKPDAWSSLPQPPGHAEAAAEAEKMKPAQKTSKRKPRK